MVTRHDRVPAWLLERLAAGELPARQADELRAALHQRGEDERLAGLAAANAEILAALPAEAVVAEIERRAAVARQRAVSRRARPRFALSLAATCAAGLVVFLIVRDNGGGVPPPAGEVAPEVIGIKGDPLEIHRKTKGGSELVRDQAVVRRGDTLQLGYRAVGKRFGVIASVDARGTVTLHLPESPGPAVALERNGTRSLPHSFELDDAPGFERFVFVRSDARFRTTDVASALASGHDLPAGLAVFEITLTKETP